MSIQVLSSTEVSQLEKAASYILDQAKALGATSAEVGASLSCGLGTTVRLGAVENVEFTRDQSVGVTVYCGQQRGHASSTDLRESSLKSVVRAAYEIAKQTQPDPFSGLADPELMAYGYPDLDLCHPWDISTERAIEMATRCERIALDADKRITNSEGASVSTSQSISVYANSHGFVGSVPTTRHSISCVLVAEDGKGMERDYDYTVSRDPNALIALEQLANSAVSKTVSRLSSQTLKTQSVPVIFSSSVASSLIGHFIGAISGSHLYRKTSFLLDAKGKSIFPDFIHIDERPHLKKYLGSCAFDSEGVRTTPRDIVRDGILQGYVLGSYSARKLGLQTTGNAGGVNNLHVSTSDKDLQQLIKEMNRGLLITELMGQGVRLTTGDYSRGASGFWVENGEIQFPVAQITIAGNLQEMFRGIVAVGNDIDIRKNIITGSIFINNMMIAGD